MASAPRVADARESSAAAASGSMPAGASNPSAMMASTELGVYVKWALLLQVLAHTLFARAACLGSGIAPLRTLRLMPPPRRSS
jgi:hypothetical protein